MSINPSFGILNIPNATIRAAGVNTSVLHVTTLVSNTATIDGDINFTGNLYQNGSIFGGGEWSPKSSNISYTAGNVGIGTTNPTSKFHVYGGNLEIENNGSDDMDNKIIFSEIGFQDKFFIGSDLADVGASDQHLRFGFTAGGANGITNSNVFLDIAGNGNVGIGTTETTHKLHIKTSDASALFLDSNGGISYPINIDFRSYSTQDPVGARISVVDDNNWSSHMTFHTKNVGTATASLEQRMIITSGNGNVGVGTTNPEYRLHVSGIFAADSMRFLNADYAGNMNGQTGISSGTWYTAIPAGELVAGALYMVEVYYAASGSPWEASGVLFIRPVNGNTTQNNYMEANVPTSCHDPGGGDPQIIVRGLHVTGGVSTGLEIKSNMNFHSTNATWSIKAWRVK